MDLLGGYGSDDSDNSQSSSEEKQDGNNVKNNLSPQNTRTRDSKTFKRGKKLLSLNAVLPPEIWERLTKYEDEMYSSDDSVGDEKEPSGAKRGNSGKKRRREEGDRAAQTALPSVYGGGVKSLLDELKSAKRKGKKTSGKKEEKLGFAFTAVSTSVTKANHGHVVDVHQTKNASSDQIPPTVQHPEFPRVSPTRNNHPQPSTTQHGRPGISSVPRPSSVKLPPMAQIPYPPQTSTNPIAVPPYPSSPQPTPPRTISKKEYIRALRTNKNLPTALTPTIEIDQPNLHYDPTQAVSSHAYASAMRKANDGTEGVDLYDPKEGGFVRNSDISGKAKGKHQINSLMQSARILEAHKNTVGFGGGNGGRVDAKKKYGW